MKHLRFSLPLLIWSLTASFAQTAEPAFEPLKASPGDILKFLGAHAWKWDYRAPAPYRSISVKLVHYTRKPDGTFERAEILGNSSKFLEAHTSDEILIICGEKAGHYTFFLSSGLGSVTSQEPSALLSNEYSAAGIVDGGIPWKLGSEYILLSHFKDNKFTENKDDLLSYVSVEIETH